MRLFVISLLLSAVAFAQEVGQGRIEGRVVSTAGEPVAGAAVRLYASRGSVSTIYVEVTTADGSFAVGGLPPGTYLVDVQKAGYQPAGGAARATIEAGETERIDVQLREMITVSGRVVDRRGDPVPNATVVLRSPTIDLTPPDGWPPPPTASNDTARMFTVWSTRPLPGRPTGWWASAVAWVGDSTRIEALPPGDYFAVAWEQYPPQEIAAEPAFLARFAPLAARVTVEDGGRASVQAALVPREELSRILTEAPIP